MELKEYLDFSYPTTTHNKNNSQLNTGKNGDDLS